MIAGLLVPLFFYAESTVPYRRLFFFLTTIGSCHYWRIVSCSLRYHKRSIQYGPSGKLPFLLGQTHPTTLKVSLGWWTTAVQEDLGTSTVLQYFKKWHFTLQLYIKKPVYYKR